MGTKSKFFRAFVEGQTISDGRTVTAEMIDEIVATFNIETYTPGINIEHIAGFSPEPPFNRYGDVIAVKAQDDEITVAGKTETRRALYAQVDAHDALVKLAEKGQKPFPSVELTPDYSGAGKIGLVNIAFTDNPASIATQKLKFSRAAPGTLFGHGTEGTALEFDAKPIEATGIAEAITSGLTGFFAKFARSEPEKPKVEEPKKPANDNIDLKEFATAFGAQVGQQIAAAVKPANDAVATMQAEFATLKAKLEQTPEIGGTFTRNPATGGGNAILTDC